MTVLSRNQMPNTKRVKGYFERVYETVKRLNQQLAADPDEIVQAGDFRLNVTARKASLRGKDLELTSAEFDLLLFLINHPKRLITPQTRLATNWSATAVRQAEFLPTLLSLRKKLENVDRSRCYIRTEPWVFYRFDASASVYEISLHDEQTKIAAAMHK